MKIKDNPINELTLDAFWQKLLSVESGLEVDEHISKQ